MNYLVRNILNIKIFLPFGKNQFCIFEYPYIQKRKKERKNSTCLIGIPNYEKINHRFKNRKKISLQNFINFIS